MKKAFIYIFATIGIISTLGLVVLAGYMLGRSRADVATSPIIENTPTETVAPTVEPIATPTFEPTVTPTPIPTEVLVPTETPIPTNTPTPLPTSTPTPLPTNTPTPLPTNTPTPTPTNKPVPTPTKAPSLKAEHQEILDEYKIKYPDAWLEEYSSTEIEIHLNDGSGHVEWYEKNSETGKFEFKAEYAVPNEMFTPKNPTPTPTTPPYPKGKVTESVTFFKTDEDGNTYTEEVLCEGYYVADEGYAYFVPSGLESQGLIVLLDSEEAAWLWQDKYPDARYNIKYVTDTNGNKVEKYLLMVDGDDGGSIDGSILDRIDVDNITLTD